MNERKIVLLGDSGVGKTSLSLTAANKLRLATPTIGVDFVALCHKNERIQLWDTAGQESFRSITRSYYRSADVAVFVFDIQIRSSFDSMNYWVDEFKQHNSGCTSILLVGNIYRHWMRQGRCVSKADAEELASTIDATYIEGDVLNQDTVNLVLDNCVSKDEPEAITPRASNLLSLVKSVLSTQSAKCF